jgi:predicted pyridoxine 5'-phosphate oxidase superfamily flavin-nucleotide-binding protein
VGNRFAELTFTDNVRAAQEAAGSRSHYARTAGGSTFHAELTPREIEFIQTRDSFYMASVGETGWPYVQHRGGPQGFLKVLDEKTLGFADFRGNRQYISLGNIRHDDRVALILMDFPSRTRLKLLGHIRVLRGDDPDLGPLRVPDYRALVERGFVIQVAAFDWNCSQHITPRYTSAEIERLVSPLKARIRALEAKLRNATPGFEQQTPST